MAEGTPPRRRHGVGRALRGLPYVVAALIIVCGLALVCGVMTLKLAGGSQVRVTMGIVAILYGALRVVQLRQRAASRGGQ